MINCFDSRKILGLVVVLAIGFVVRIWGIDFGLPHVYSRPDETTLVYKALSIGAGDPNPHFFHYPTLYFYVLVGVFAVYFVASYMTGVYTSLLDFQYHFFLDPSSLFIVGRLCTACLGTASIFLVYVIGRRLCSERAAWLSAVFLCLASLHVRDSHFVTVDIAAVFCLLVALTATVFFLESGHRKYWLGAALSLGLAISTKYSLALFGPAIIGSIAVRGTFSLRRACVALTLMTGGFLLGSPYVVADFSAFWKDFTAESRHFVAGHGIDLGNGWKHHIVFSLAYGMGWPLLIAGLAGLFLFARTAVGCMLLAGMAVYFAVAGSGGTVFMRYMLPVVPLLCLSAAATVDFLQRRWLRRGWSLLALCLIGPTAVGVLQSDRLLARTDTRLLAGDWIVSHIPDGARIALYGTDYGQPLLHRTRYWMTERLTDLRGQGLSAKRLQRQLSLNALPSVPSYYTVDLKHENTYGWRSVRTVFDPKSLRRDCIRWVVVQEHPLQRADASVFHAMLQREAVLVGRFMPLVAKQAPPVYDPIDAFYVPVAGYSGVSRPGPSIYIYDLGSV